MVDTAAGEAGATPTPPAPSAAAPYSEGRSFPVARLGEDGSEIHDPMAPSGSAGLSSNGPPASSDGSGKDCPSSRVFFRGDGGAPPGYSDGYPTLPAYRSTHGDARDAATGDESEEDDDDDDYPVYQPPHLRNPPGPPPPRRGMMPPSPPGTSATMPPRYPHLPPNYRHGGDECARYERQRGICEHEREHRQYTPPPPPPPPSNTNHHHHHHPQYYHPVGDAAAGGGRGSSSRHALTPR